MRNQSIAVFNRHFELFGKTALAAKGFRTAIYQLFMQTDVIPREFFMALHTVFTVCLGIHIGFLHGTGCIFQRIYAFGSAIRGDAHRSILNDLCTIDAAVMGTDNRIHVILD